MRYSTEYPVYEQATQSDSKGEAFNGTLGLKLDIGLNMTSIPNQIHRFTILTSHIELEDSHI